MDEEIQRFVGYLENVKKVSRNTVMSYHGDLGKMTAYMKNQGSVQSMRSVRHC